jgi:hypothetical protein
MVTTSVITAMMTIANVYSSMLFICATGCLKASKTMSQASPPFVKTEGGKLFSGADKKSYFFISPATVTAGKP